MSASSERAPVGLRISGFLGSSRYRLAVAGFLLLGVALFGGTSRIDEPSQLAVRLAAVAAAAASLWPMDFAALRQHRRFIFFSAACIALPLIQLIPLPPGLWDRMPGHQVYADIARATATVGWRPLSLAPDLTIDALLALAVPAAVLLATLYLDGNGRKAAAAAFVTMGFASAMLGLAQLAVSGDALRLYQHTSENAPVGLFANRNHQAVLLACAFPLCAATIPAGTSARARAVMYGFLAPAALIVTVVLLFTGSRMGIFLWACASVGTAWTLRTRGLLRLPTGRVATFGWILCGLAVVGVVVAAPLFDRAILVRFRYQDLAADTRWASLPSLLATASAFLPFGAGFGSFASIYPQFEPTALLSTIYLNEAHDEPVQLAIEGGVPAIVLLALFCGWWVRAAVQIAWHGRRLPQRGLPRAAVVVTALLMLSSLVDYPLRTPLLAALFAFCCVEMAIASRGGRAEG